MSTTRGGERVTGSSDEHPARTLSGQIAVVTGGAQGIGLRIAEVLAENGAILVLGDVQTGKVKAAAAAIEKTGATAWGGFLDVSRPAQVNRFIQSTIARFGGIDILINNAGIDAPTGQAWAEPDEHWRQIIEVDLSGQWWCTKAVLEHMIAARRGRIIFISSVAARRGSAEISVAYNAAKAGLVGLTVALAAQVERRGVLVNAIAAGPTGTSGRPTREESQDSNVVFPLGLGGTDPVAEACLYLVNRSGDWVSGSVMNVSGGAWKG